MPNNLPASSTGGVLGEFGFRSADPLALDALYRSVQDESFSRALGDTDRLLGLDFAGGVSPQQQFINRGGVLGVPITSPEPERRATISAEEAAAMIEAAGADLTPSEGHSRAYWALKIQYKLEEQDRQRIAQKADTGFWENAGVGIVAAMTDPVNAATMLIPGGAAGATGKTLLGGIGRGARAGFASELAIGSVLEGGVYAALKEQEQDYTATDALLNVVIGAGAGAILGGAAGGVGYALRGAARRVDDPDAVDSAIDEAAITAARRSEEDRPARPDDFVGPPRESVERLAAISPENRAAIVRTAVGQVVRGEPINIERLLDMDVMADADVIEAFNESDAVNDAIRAATSELEDVVSDKLPRQTRIALKKEAEQLRGELAELRADMDRTNAEANRLRDGADYQRARRIGEAQLRVAREFRQRTARLNGTLDEIEDKISKDKAAQAAKSELDALRARLDPDDIERRAVMRAALINQKLAEVPGRARMLTSNTATTDTGMDRMLNDNEKAVADGFTERSATPVASPLDESSDAIDGTVDEIKEELEFLGEFDAETEAELKAMREREEDYVKAMYEMAGCVYRG